MAPLSSSPSVRSHALAAGTRIGAYEIVEPIGAGGMGEVYRARDLALGRDVAIKVLPTPFADDRERVARFEREARVLASINHPAIAHVYGVEAWQSSRAIVMELVPGPTLADRIARGAVPLADALPLARQIAEALAAAHDQSIVHRDLKPANIKASDGGIVKILDFGLAKTLLEDPLAVADASTVMSPAVTAQGVILGSAAYMSPEQARGKVIDKRTDVWAFGCVLYEMLTGARAFPGEDVLETATAVLKQEPDWSRLPVEMPAAIRAMLRRCLAKDRIKRLADLHDVALVIDDVVAGVDQTPERPPASSRRLLLVAWTAAAAAISVAGAIGWVHWRAPDAVSRRFDIVTPPTTDMTMFELSPEGQRIVFVAYSGSESVLWLRDFRSTGPAAPLAGTSGASFPFWSPDGDSIGFFADGRLKRIDLPSGVIRDLAPAPNARGGTWSHYAGGTMLYSTGEGIWRLPADGGASSQVTTLQEGQKSHRHPQFLQDGHRFYYGAQGNRAGGEEAAPGGLYLMDLDGGRTARLGDGRSRMLQLSDDRVMYLLGRVGVVVQSTQVGGWQFTGDPLAAVPDVRAGLYGNGAFSWRPGTLAYRSQPSFLAQLQWFDSHGSPLAEVGTRGMSGNSGVALSPDARRAAITRGADVLTIDLQTGRETRLARGFSKVWSSDGRSVIFDTAKGIVQKAVGTDEPETPQVTADRSAVPLDVSADGRLLVEVFTDRTGWDLWVHPLHGGDDVAIVRTAAQEFQGQFRPGGDWIAYTSTESGQLEIWVKRLDERKTGQQVSTHGGVMPRWSADGTELFFLSLEGDMTVVPVGAQRGTVTLGVEKKLFRAPVNLETFRGQNTTASYAVAPDGRFLINVDRTERQPITIVTNWTPPAGLIK